MLLVDADLPADDLAALLELGELVLDVPLLLAQQVEALGLVAGPSRTSSAKRRILASGIPDLRSLVQMRSQRTSCGL